MPLFNCQLNQIDTDGDDRYSAERQRIDGKPMQEAQRVRNDRYLAWGRLKMP